MAMLLDPINGDDPEPELGPCECDVERAKIELVEFVQGLFDKYGFETMEGINTAQEERRIDRTLDDILAPVRFCERCRT